VQYPGVQGAGAPLAESLGGSVYFMPLMEESAGFITATPIKTKGILPDVIQARTTQLATLTGLKVKRGRHDSAKEYVSHDLKAWHVNKGITSKQTAPYSSQQNGKAERANRYIMERVRAALLSAVRKRSCAVKHSPRSSTCSTGPPSRSKM